MLWFAVKYQIVIDSIMANKSLKLHKFELDNDDWKIVHDLVFVLKVHIMYFILISNWQDVSNIKGPHSSFHKTMQALRPLSLPWTSSTMGSTHTQRNCTTLLSKGPCNWLVQRWTDTIQSLTNWQHTELLWVCNHRSLHYLKLISSSLVLHPGLKLDYFHVQEWEEKWVNVTNNLVCEEYICDKLGFTTKAGITRNQHCLCKLIRPVSCSSFSVSTSQKVPYLVCKTHRYDVPLQCLQGRILKNLILLEEMLKYYIISLNMFILL